jgi:hypothetical protein
MAKAKKDSSSKNEGSKKKAAAKKVAAPAGGIFVDTALAAESAARLLAAHVPIKPAADAQPHTESSLFKQLKSMAIPLTRDPPRRLARVRSSAEIKPSAPT